MTFTLNTRKSDIAYDDGNQPEGRDFAGDAGGLPLQKLENFLHEITEQPTWRRMSDYCHEYYDGNQLSPERKQFLTNMGLAPAVENLVKPTINTVLGMEAKLRSDWRVQADADEWQDVAEVQSMLLHEAERETRADQAISDAYAHQIKGGLGWVEVNRETDPFKYKYRVQHIPRGEIWWDWLDMTPELLNARWLLRKRWTDADMAALVFPKHKDLIYNTINGWAGWDRSIPLEDSPNIELVSAYADEMRTTIDQIEWRDVGRRRLMMFELWYRIWKKGWLFRGPSGRPIIYDEKNDAHNQLIGLKIVQPFEAIYSALRLSWWIGPHRIADVATKRRRFPYVPFWGFREDKTGVPYGMIRDMLWPQDEINARRSKMMWLLSAKRVTADADAIDTKINTWDQVRNEVASPDAFIITNPTRKRDKGFNVEQDFQLSAQQFSVLQDARQTIQSTAGIFQSMLGQSSQAASGLAISSLVEQGVTTLGEINDNTRNARRVVGEMIVELINEDLGKEENAEYTVGEGESKRVVVLNTVDPQTGAPINNVRMAATKIALEDVPTTAAYRAQVLAMLAEVAKALPPQAQAIVAPWLIESTELPSRNEIATVLRKLLGVPASNLPPQIQAQQDAKQNAEQERVKKLQDEAMVLDLMERAAKVLKLQAEVEATQAAAKSTATKSQAAVMGVKLAQMQATIEQLMGEMDDVTKDRDALQSEADVRTEEELAALRKTSATAAKPARPAKPSKPARLRR